MFRPIAVVSNVCEEPAWKSGDLERSPTALAKLKTKQTQRARCTLFHHNSVENNARICAIVSYLFHGSVRSAHVCVCIAGFILYFIVPSFLALYKCVYWRFVAHRVHVWFAINSIKLHYISHACVLCRIFLRIHTACPEERERGQQDSDAAREKK